MKILAHQQRRGRLRRLRRSRRGTTVQQLFAERIPHGRPQDYLIRVNRQPVAADQVLQEGDRVSLTPTKIEGAMA